MSASFSAGDVVQLKSGGPPMTVTKILNGRDGIMVFVSWFNEQGKLEHGRFAPDSLRSLED